MMDFVVKNTTIKWVLDLFCPDVCLSCGRVGTNLCECCKKNIKWVEVEELERRVVEVDKMVCEWGDGCEDEDDRVLDGLFAVGERSGVLEKMMHKYKFYGDRFLAGKIAGMMCERILEMMKERSFCEKGEEGEGLRCKVGEVCDYDGVDGTNGCFDLNEELKKRMVVTAVPTISRHVRERGFDHAGLLAREIAKRLECEYTEVFERKKNTVQVGADGETRKKQAKAAYEVKNEAKIAPERVYLVIDDVWTTGASVVAAAMKLKRKGAVNVFGAVFLVGK